MSLLTSNFGYTPHRCRIFSVEHFYKSFESAENTGTIGRKGNTPHFLYFALKRNKFTESAYAEKDLHLNLWACRYIAKYQF